MSNDIRVEEIRLHCSDGMEIAGQRWTTRKMKKNKKQQQQRRILCLHGFLDNCRSFYWLAPFLVSKYEKQEQECEVVALDFPGHGLSSHRSMDAPPMLIINDLCYAVREACRVLQWDENGFVLIGHSMGSIISILYASTFPKQVQQLILLDGYGPDSYDHFATYMKEYGGNNSQQQEESKHPKSALSERIHRHVCQRFDRNVQANNNNKKKNSSRTYPNIQAAVHTRQRTAELSPGNQWISSTAALELVKRATTTIHIKEEEQEDRVRFIHDSRLHLPPLIINTMEQVDTYWNHITCPTVLWLRANDGWPFPKSMLNRAEEQLKKKKNMECHVEYLPGSHHFHADPDTANAVGYAILKSITTTTNGY